MCDERRKEDKDDDKVYILRKGRHRLPLIRDGTTWKSRFGWGWALWDRPEQRHVKSHLLHEPRFKGKVRAEDRHLRVVIV